MIETKTRNVYQEFEALLSEMAEDITTHIISEVVDSPLSDLYEKYKAQIPLVELNNVELQQFIAELNRVKEQLEASINKTAQDISQVVIEKHVLEKMRKLFFDFEQHLAEMAAHGMDIQEIVLNLEATEQHLTEKLEMLTAEVAVRVLKESVMKEFQDLYRQFDRLLPTLNVTNKVLGKSIEQFNQSVDSLKMTVDQVAETVTKTVTGVIHSDLKATLKSYEELVRDIRAKLPQLDVMVDQVNELKKTMKQDNYDLFLKLEKKIKTLHSETTQQINQLEKKQVEENRLIAKRITFFGSISLMMLAIILYFVVAG
jgi:ABC-type transporter Mla subunit MlaD